MSYDKFGGFGDHLSPSKKDWGPGPRIPTLLVFHFCEGGKVQSKYYDMPSI
ncbi:alkaline phosphatase family protein [Methylacidiphilum sp. Yel]|uniref:alkaline phosphatase family protein n=1 Tax=Methylacidiphilum sp. Yel TaxID=1847730 RepID=UPI003744770A